MQAEWISFAEDWRIGSRACAKARVGIKRNRRLRNWRESQGDETPHGSAILPPQMFNIFR